MRDLAGFATQLKTASQPAAQQKSSGTQDAKATGSQVLSKISDEFLGQMDLSTTASDRAIANAQKKVDAFVAANPNATEAQVTEEARKALGNTSTSEYIFKSIISKSMNDIMAKVQEQIDDAK
ncbi:hypothetical protein OV207_22030 [Corallococcus sp. BB11-1]|nr:hypothetical protein [Corallococcus sp. BB11-1]MCY1034149.1 hypothetical protein [Corallococcus sp. BB11-1]